MKAVSGSLPADPDGWLFEIKWDGVRVIATLDHGALRLASASGRDITASYPELAALAADHGDHLLVLDGEVVALDDRGVPDFGRLQGRMHVADAQEAYRRAVDTPIVYQVFDLLRLDDHELLTVPVADRRRLLTELVDEGPHWRVPPSYDDGAALLQAAVDLGLEGIVAKRADSPYTPGARSPAWRKVKVRRQQELVVGGWTDGTGNRAGHLGALLVGYHDGEALRFAGRVGSGLNGRDLGWWRSELEARAVEDCPFEPLPPAADRRVAHWARPELVVEVAFAEWSRDGRLRHPSYLGRRNDKDPLEVVREP
jgi:bifunctional non-homologous end joining protein LigD